MYKSIFIIGIVLGLLTPNYFIIAEASDVDIKKEQERSLKDRVSDLESSVQELKQIISYLDSVCISDNTLMSETHHTDSYSGLESIMGDGDDLNDDYSLESKNNPDDASVRVIIEETDPVPYDYNNALSNKGKSKKKKKNQKNGRTSKASSRNDSTESNGVCKSEDESSALLADTPVESVGMIDKESCYIRNDLFYKDRYFINNISSDDCRNSHEFSYYQTIIDEARARSNTFSAAKFVVERFSDRFLLAFPQSKCVDDANQWINEAYWHLVDELYCKEDYEEIITNFRQMKKNDFLDVNNDFSDLRMPLRLFRIGEVYMYFDMNRDACKLFNTVNMQLKKRNVGHSTSLSNESDKNLISKFQELPGLVDKKLKSIDCVSYNVGSLFVSETNEY